MLKATSNLLAAILVSACLSHSLAAAHPLFESDETLSLVLELPLNELLRRAQRKPTVTGVLRYVATDGTEVVLDVSVSTRGKSRLEHCSFPPLGINLKRQQLASTIFAGQNKLKLVTQCRRQTVYRRYLNQEYAIYKAYNLLSGYSFRVRMLEVTYRDASGRRPDMLQPAFFIESDDEAAARQDMTPVDADVVGVSQLDAEQLSIFTLFQFMIGNTDWSVRKGPGEEGCCHNGKVIAPPDSNSGWVVLPYDFDQAGIINTEYSAPSEQLPIRRVRQRLYRGFCSNNEKLDATIATFNEHRGAIEDIFRNAPDGASKNKSALKYLQSFYDIVNDSKQQQKKILAACQGKAKR
jgi:hypothetical protein